MAKSKKIRPAKIVDRNLLGERGEARAFLALTETGLFKPVFLGGKNEAHDFYVEVVGDFKRKPYFFVQVKTTRSGYDKAGRLKVRLTKKDVRKLLGVSAPTYLLGVDDTNQRPYIFSIHRPGQKAVSSMAVNYPMDGVNLRRLKEEVVSFWKAVNFKPTSSYFS